MNWPSETILATQVSSILVIGESTSSVQSVMPFADQPIVYLLSTRTSTWIHPSLDTNIGRPSFYPFTTSRPSHGSAWGGFYSATQLEEVGHQWVVIGFTNALHADCLACPRITEPSLFGKLRSWYLLTTRMLYQQTALKVGLWSLPRLPYFLTKTFRTLNISQDCDDRMSRQSGFT